MTLLQDRDAARMARDAREWLMEDERRKVIGLVVASIALSITMAVLMTVIMGVVARRRAAATAAEPEPGDTPAGAAPDATAGVAVMDVPASRTEAMSPAEA
jgi:hypothetical protein